MEEYDEFNIGVQFKAADTVSITYALMSRCGLEPERYFDHEDFMAIFDFNTPSTIGALGTAVSQINQQVLRQIDETAQSRLEQMMPQLAKEAGATEELKASDPMKWVGLMNTCKAQAEEILMAELINS